MKFFALFFSVLPCFVLAQNEANTTIDTTKPSAVDKLYDDVFGEGIDKPKEGWKRFENEEVIKVDFPKDWEVVENFMETVFLIKEPASDEDKFAENVNLVRELAQASKSDEADVSLQHYVEQTLIEHRNYFEEFEMIEHTDGFYQKHKAVILLFRGKADDIDFKIKQYFFIINDYVYTFTFTSLINNFDTYSPIAKDIYKSLKVN